MTGQVSAKFFVTGINQLHNGCADTDQAAEVTLAPVYGSYAGNEDAEENTQWSKYTPSGEIKMMITNPKAVEKFELGKAYYVDFTAA